MAKLNFKDKWILVTGASSGLGKAIALNLAKKEQANVVIAARRVERLEALKQEIESSTSCKVEVIPADLGKDEDVENLFKQSTEKVDLYGVINNAGLTYYGNADSAHLEKFETIINVNFKSLMALTLKFLDRFKEKGEGAILNVTSETAFLPIPYQAVYSATKHAAQAFTESLYMENKKSGVVISTFVPGGIATEMLEYSGLDQKHDASSPFNMDAGKCAKLAVKTLKKKKFHSVPGFMNKLTAFLVRFFPRKWVAFAAEMIYRPLKETK
jgi:short-subunit dehydrogenase